MSRLPLFLLLTLTAPCALYPQSSPPPPALTEAEKRRILSQLLELRSCLASVSAYEGFVAHETEQDAKEKVLAARALDLERQATALAQKERDLQKERADLYESLYRSVTRKPGLGCRILRVLSLGLARCD